MVQLVHCCLQKERYKRPPDAATVRDDLDRIAKGSLPKNKKRRYSKLTQFGRRYGGALALSLLLGIVAYVAGSKLYPTAPFEYMLHQHDKAWSSMNYQEAAKHSAEMIEESKKLWPDQAIQAFAVAANDQRQIGNRDLASQYNDEAGTISLKRGYPDYALGYWMTEIKLLFEQKKFTRAQQVTNLALKVANEHASSENLFQRIELLRMLSRTQEYMNDLKQAQASAMQANQLLDANPEQAKANPMESFVVREQMGNICLKAGESTKAVDYLEKADQLKAICSEDQLESHNYRLSTARNLLKGNQSD
jgi:tetratricopeptide (TPR) repeat protein